VVRRVGELVAALAQGRGGAEGAGEGAGPEPAEPRAGRAEPGEIQALEDAAKTERDKLMIRLMADTGMRVSELLSLRVTDLMG
jgi:integrase